MFHIYLDLSCCSFHNWNSSDVNGWSRLSVIQLLKMDNNETTERYGIQKPEKLKIE